LIEFGCLQMGTTARPSEVSRTDDEADALWAARKRVLWSILALKKVPSDHFLSADAAVLVSKLAGIIERTHERLDNWDLRGPRW
jgi:D-lactate dehydrogenase (cytochrome)